MKRLLALVWLLLPLPLIVLHFTKGQGWLEIDRARLFVSEGEAAEKRGDWVAAEASYLEAAKRIASTHPDLKLRLDLSQLRTRFRKGAAVDAIDLSESLLNDPAFKSMSDDFRVEARELSARIRYYAAWVMRLEGAQRDLWMEEAEIARQNYRLLVEQNPQSADSTSPQKKDLESAVQLQRLSLTELMARPLPEEGQAMANQGLTEQMGRRRGQRGKQPGVGPASDGPPNDGAGNDRFQPGSGS